MKDFKLAMLDLPKDWTKINGLEDLKSEIVAQVNATIEKLCEHVFKENKILYYSIVDVYDQTNKQWGIKIYHEFHDMPCNPSELNFPQEALNQVYEMNFISSPIKH